ncbi:hypothetical protein H0A36_07835 [Endozoicomonas sp. SM1973]|uniref:Uncharacterized protein n=1 Tax=Spartinivicinus marinus TaxID=2994442 RepID=A0A853HXG5_9GAMM|nr:hypothetical protein [Spartinivicinus marinus]MCX4029168.1 hypothetical protein [Spartinivicinus marinus]NYZ65923.1 hypothetical protein [Spartinivicinus marinus]
MYFKVVGSRVQCIRQQLNTDNTLTETMVVSFDSHLTEVAPHVAAKLSSDEIGELKCWLRGRNVPKQIISEYHLLEMLPEIIAEANFILAKQSHLDKKTFYKLTHSIEELTENLNRLNTRTGTRLDKLKIMEKDEILFEPINQEKGTWANLNNDRAPNQVRAGI